jgi:hypothetical protein
VRRAVTISIAVLLLTSIPAGAEARQTLSVRLLAPATIIEHGQAATLPVLLSCPPRSEVLEALAYISQDDQAVYWEGSILNIVCDGHRHRTMAEVHPQEGELHRGRAYAAVYVLLIDDSSAGDNGMVPVRSAQQAGG